MPVRRRGNKLERWEIALIKAMIANGQWPNDQDILAYFTRPTRSINHRAISEIRNGAKHQTVKVASQEELESFIATWPEVDPQTGLSLRGDELLIKAREAMISAVHSFNSAGLTFRSELYIVTSIIGWTYLMHAWFKREGVDYRYKKREAGQDVVVKTPSGADKYWDLAQCLKHAKCPISAVEKANLEFLLEIRHEIEHRSTTRIDDAISAKLQACCINFNTAIKEMFGAQYGLERRLPIALQFVTFSTDQLAILKRASSLPRHIESMVEGFHNRLSDEQRADPRFAYRVAFVQKIASRVTSADEAIEFVKGDSDEAREINRILLKEVERKKYLPSEIVALMQQEGFARFTMDSHTKLWKRLDAKVPAKGYGAISLGRQWGWYDHWVNRVREECQQHPEIYGPVA